VDAAPKKDCGAEQDAGGHHRCHASRVFGVHQQVVPGQELVDVEIEMEAVLREGRG